MDIIEVTRELGRALQNDERYIAMVAARQASDEDQALQEAIGEFNLKRMAINKEAQKEDRNEETMKRLNEEFRAVYAKIMENEHMLRYNDAKTNSTPCCSASPASSACAPTARTRRPAITTPLPAAATAPPAPAATKGRERETTAGLQQARPLKRERGKGW